MNIPTWQQYNDGKQFEIDKGETMEIDFNVEAANKKLDGADDRPARKPVFFFSAPPVVKE